MLGLPLAFAVPAVLAAFALLPALWRLLRLTPPRPREIPFPPLRLLLDLRRQDETPAHTPWWLMALRLALAAVVILAMAGPIWNPPSAAQQGKGPLLVLVDDGWSVAPDWEARRDFVSRTVEAGIDAGRSVVLAPMSDAGRSLTPVDPADWSARLRAMQPQPWIPDRMQAADAVRDYLTAHPGAQVVWVADDLAEGGARAFAHMLVSAAPGRVGVVTGENPPAGIASAANGSSALDVALVRAGSSGPANGIVRALDRKGLEIGRASFSFGASDAATARFDLPVDLRNQVARVEIFGERAAGAVSLLDSRSQRRRVGVISGDSSDLALPYVAPDYFIDKALTPYADLRNARPGEVDPIADIVGERPAAIILTDVGRIEGPDHDKLAAWVNRGGALIRFAGTRLAESTDDLIPVDLREGGRVLGAALSWDTPKRLAPFDRSSPFFGLTPPAEVTVRRQVLADPDADLPGKVWASLADGTPLVTAARRGKGLLVLFHVTADTSWSNLPLSGLFVDMLRRVVNLSVEPGSASRAEGAAAARNVAAPSQQAVAPTSTLDGYGELGPPPATARPIPADFSGRAGLDHPPGFYGPVEASIAVNALAPGDRLLPADFSGLGLRLGALKPSQSVDLRPPLLVAAFTLFLLDALAALWLSGAFRRKLRAAATTAVLAGLVAVGGLGLSPRPAFAQDQGLNVPQKDIQAALQTRLAYVVTGDAAIDAESKAGLTSLSEALTARTSFTPGPPVGVDPASDELVFYPMLYWPIAPSEPQPSANAVARIAAYMKNGGTIVFDTRDALEERADAPPTPEQMWLRALLRGVDVPELEPVPSDHVVTKTFYLLDNFVGRTTIGRTWIQALPPPNPNDPTARPVRAGDGVSPIIITSNDLAAAWAAGPEGEPLYPLIPGGDRQRELAIRGGINIVMYSLTGNYKADQVHVRDLLERLSH